jgi:S-DNA-T family DNA segregation ATPase FtsK/SpoIIIE
MAAGSGLPDERPPGDRGAFHRPPRSFPPALPRQPVVIAQPPALARRSVGGIVQMALPVLGTLGILAFAFVMPSKVFLIVGGVFVGLAVISVLGSYWSQKRSGKLSARTERRLYRAHLQERERQLQTIARRQREVDERLYPDPTRLAGVVSHRRGLWERRPADEDFLAFRLGRAAVPLACPVELTLSEDPLIEYQPELHRQAQELVARYRQVERLAVLTSLAGANFVTLYGPRERTTALARALLAQACVFRAPSDLRVMAHIAPGSEHAWAWLKWMPHSRSGHGQEREGHGVPSLLLSRGVSELQLLLEAHVQPRLEQLRRIESSTAEGAGAEVDAPELLLVLDSFHAGSEVARLPLIRELALRGRNLKIRTLCLVDEDSAEPAEAELRVIVPSEGGAVLERTGSAGYRVAPIALDQLSATAAETLARRLAPLHLEESSAGIDLAAEIHLRELLDEPVGPLCAPIGVSEQGDRLVLDLKQAADGGMGPHGLIVGATGSGKSELLRTIVTSLALAHRPDELCFVFVDFKGGAAFAELAALPHAAGMITNLQHDLSLVDRMHAALFGEQQRRQAILRAAGNLDDITAYRALAAARPELDPLPHLLVIVDEFGELLANRPDFIDLFLAIGRVGRSLGIHLLLSSQRLEEGRLRGLEGHLRYRICLRTYSAQESKSVLGSADAFLLPPFPGVGYLSVDTDVYERFKTALVTTPRARLQANRARVAPFEISALTPPAGDVSAPEEGAPSDLEVFVAQVRARHGDGGSVHQVWLPPLPACRALAAPGEEPGAGAPRTLRACVGLLDRPSEQRQDPFMLDLAGVGGHLALVGAPQTGKSTFLRTLLLSLMLAYEPARLRIYALDFGGGLLRALEPAPHIGGVCVKNDAERVEATVRQLHALIGEREATFREFGIDSMSEARARAREGRLSPEHGSDVLLVIDNWAALLREYEGLADALAEIAGGGLQYGVHLVVTAGRWAEIRPAVREAFGSRLELRLNDPMDSDFGRRVAESLPVQTPGRGVTPGGLQFQVALPRLDGRDQIDGLGEVLSRHAEELAHRFRDSGAPPIRVLPGELALAQLPLGKSGIILGVEELTLAPVELDLERREQHLLILGEPGSGRTSALRTIAHALARRCSPDQARLVVVDFRRGLEDLLGLALPATLISRPPQLDEVLGELREQTIERLRVLDSGEAGGWRGPHAYVLIDDFDLVSGVLPGQLSPLAELIFQGRDAGIHVILARSTAGSARAMLDPVISRLVESGAPALLLSGDPHEGPLLRGVRGEQLPAGRARLVRRRGRFPLVQLALAQPRAAGERAGSPRARLRG